MENLLKEEDSVVQRRLQARKALNDVKASLYQVGGGGMKVGSAACRLARHSMTSRPRSTRWAVGHVEVAM